MFSFRATKKSVLHALAKKDLSFKELVKLMTDINAQKKELSSGSKFNNISINININKNEIHSPGEESPRFKVNATHSFGNSSHSGLFSLHDQSSRKGSLATSRSSTSNENSKKLKMIVRNLKEKLVRDGLITLMETVRCAHHKHKFHTFWKVHQIVNFKIAVHAQIRDHISKKSYIPRFMKLIYQ